VTFADITFVRNPPIAGPLTLNKVEPIPTRADRLRRDHERDPRTAVPVFLALRGTRRPAGPGLPLPRRPPVGGGAREARGGPRCPGARPERRRRGRAPSSRQRGRAMIDVRRARIDLEAVLDSVRRDDAGAIVLFVGTVRSDEGIRALGYEVYRPMAIKSLTA